MTIRLRHVILASAIIWCLMIYAAFAAELTTGPGIINSSSATPAAADPRIACPTPGEKCKILTITEQEERLLMGQNGVLDTAAQARNLDLGAFVVYFKTRIAGAPAGEVASPPVSQGKGDKDNSKPPLDK